MAKHLAIVGDPVEHSRSPQLHSAAYAALGLDWSYERVRVPAGQLADFVARLDDSWLGLSVTMPLKGEARALAVECDDVSSVTGVANTLVSVDSRYRPTENSTNSAAFRAFNTDVAGLENPIRRLGISTLSSATLIGAGATAKSALVALSHLGCRDVSVVVRDTTRVDEVTELASTLGLNLATYALTELASVPQASLTISSVPGGANVSLDELSREADDLLFDIAYDVWPSPVARAWATRGGRTLSGLSMLAAQALEQVRIFVTGAMGHPLPDEERVRRAMFDAVGLDESGLVVRSVG